LSIKHYPSRPCPASCEPNRLCLAGIYIEPAWSAVLTRWRCFRWLADLARVPPRTARGVKSLEVV